MDWLYSLASTHEPVVVPLMLVGLIVVVGFLARAMRAHEKQCNEGREEARADRARLTERVDGVGRAVDGLTERVSYLERK